MVKQGNIVMVNFNPQMGHEQAGYRPALIISNDIFNTKTNLVIGCPITSTDNHFPLHVPLDERTTTKGVVLCEQVKALDLRARQYKVVEQIPADLLERVVDIVYSEIECNI